jgi:hypothetical protein
LKAIGLTAEALRHRGQKKKKHQMGITWIKGLHGLKENIYALIHVIPI